MTVNLAKDAAELSRAVRIEAWLKENRDLWPYLREMGWFTETLDRIEAGE